MAILKCKMCGGDLNITADEKIVECEFCGTTQTIPDGNDEKKTNLFNRANRLRIANEFDKASGIYESIIAEFPDEAESYWGLCLCKFGIEYVDDPKTAKKIPTCHRTSFESIFDDENYKMALEKSDVIAQGVYKEEATVIDNLQKDILSIVHKEEPFDVFICYKETDELGQRTQDSVLAQDIYDALTDKGFKVFFSRITLEDKLGKQYEPYIFAALNSAKIMLAIGTKEEYYNAVWVKNEWSRFLALMEKDKEKTLIPCYRDIDPYDMPQEFKNLQGQDMSKLGFLQDLVRGIAKIINPEREKQVQTETSAPTAANATVDSLLKRAFMFLEEGSWDKADEYFEKVLDIDPECAEAYLGKLMLDLKVTSKDSLCKQELLYDENPNYKKALRFADENQSVQFEGYIENTSENIYARAVSKMNSNDFQSLADAIDLFSRIPLFKDSKILKQKCMDSKQGYLSQKHDKLYSLGTHIAIGYDWVAYRKNDSTVEAVGDFSACEDVAKWKDVVNISAGFSHLLGVKKDGTVCAAGNKDNSRCEVADWNEIVEASAGSEHSVGLKFDGTVVATGNNDYGQCNVDGWRNVAKIIAKGSVTYAITNDGKVLFTGDDRFNLHLATDWKNIKDIITNGAITIGLQNNGNVLTTGKNPNVKYDFKDWRDVVAISSCGEHTVGLRNDGTVLAMGKNQNGQCDVGEWRNIVSVVAAYDMTVGIDEKGEVYFAGRYNQNIEALLKKWKDIVIVFSNGGIVVGLNKSGRFLTIPSKFRLKNTVLFETSEELEHLIDNIKIMNQSKLMLRKEKTEEQILRDYSEKERIAEEQSQEDYRIQIVQQKAKYRNAGVCQYCGGTFKGLFTKTCVNCGKKKDY